MRRSYNPDTRDKENLDSIAAAFVDMLSVLRRRAITPSTVTADSITIESEKGEIIKGHFLKLLLRCSRNVED